MKVRRLGITRIVSEEEYQNYWKSKGYEIVEEKSDLADMNYSELYGLAQEEEIEGRSTMSTKELREALEKAR